MEEGVCKRGGVEPRGTQKALSGETGRIRSGAVEEIVAWQKGFTERAVAQEFFFSWIRGRRTLVCEGVVEGGVGDAREI